MITFEKIKALGFKKIEVEDSVYENIYGRPYWFMEYVVTIYSPHNKNEIIFTWDTNTATVTVHKNHTELIETFTDYSDFIKLFVLLN